MSDTVKKELLFGAGELYMYEFEGTEIPSDDVIETDEHCVGNCSSGFSIDYKPTKYDVKNQYGKIVKSFITDEACTAKTGILDWDMGKLELLSTGKYTKTEATTSTKEIRKIVIGGSGNALKTVIVRFVHTKSDGNKLRFTMIGQGGNGFALNFENKEVPIDVQIEAIEYVKNFLFSIEEEVGKVKSGS